MLVFWTFGSFGGVELGPQPHGCNSGYTVSVSALVFSRAEWEGGERVTRVWGRRRGRRERKE